MATEYSLLTWAGLGTAVTLSASTHLVTFANHGAPVGHAFRFAPETTTMPTIGGVQATVNDVFYVASGSYAAGAFRISAAADGSIPLTITNAGSGVKIVGNYWASLPATDPGNGGNYRGRYFYDGVYRVYAKKSALGTGLTGSASLAKDAIIEVEGKWADTSGTISFSGYKSITMHSKINGVRSSAFHWGVIGNGWVDASTLTTASAYTISQPNVTIDGLELKWTGATTSRYGFYVELAAVNLNISNNIIQAPSGIFQYSPDGLIANNLIYDCYSHGIINRNGTGMNMLIAFNTITGCGGTGMFNETGICQSAFIGNISIGNTTADWTPVTPSGRFYAAQNGGLSTDANVWDTASNHFHIATTDFENFAANLFKPAAITSPQVNLIALADGDGLPRYDITDAVRPNHNPDTTPWNATAGPFEFDTGHGLAPNYQSFTISGLISGSRVKVKKAADGTVIHNAVVNATSLTISYNAGTAPTQVTIDIAKGNAAPFYYRYRTTSSISHLGASGVSVAQIPDIARGATYPAGVATDWAVNTTTKAISNAAGTTVYTVQDLYSWLCDYYDHADRVDLDMPMYGTTSEIFGLQNGGSISDAHMQKLKGGSIKDGTTLWPNVYTVGSQAPGTPIYVHVNGVLYTSFWPTGNIDVLLKLTNWAGTEVVDVRAHNYTDTYDHWRMTVSSEGRNVAAISTVDDPDNQTAAATVAGWNDITVTVNNPTGKQIDASDTPANYTMTIDGGGRPVAEVYERLKWLTKSASTYVSADASFPEVKVSPYGTLSAGIFSGAQGIWLQNIASADLLKYVLTDNAGVPHQAAVPLGYQSVTVSGGVAGTRLQVYDATSSTELYNGVPGAWPYVWEDVNPWAADRSIRIRAAYVDGTAAKEFIEANIGTSTEAVPAVTYLLSQRDDSVYISNAIDGSAVTGVTFTDASTDLININIPSATVSLKTIYAAFVYWMFTEAGIADDIAYIEAKDGANYVFTQMKIKNTSSPAVATKITGGYFWDAASGDIADCIDTTGGNVFPVPTHVVEKIITVSGVNVITGDIADIPAGGLTTGEHDQLMATLTESAFIGLK